MDVEEGVSPVMVKVPTLEAFTQKPSPALIVERTKKPLASAYSPWVVSSGRYTAHLLLTHFQDVT